MSPAVHPGWSAWYEAVEAAGRELAGLLARIRAQEDAGELTTLQAAHARIAALENHLAAVQLARRLHLGGGDDE